MEDKMRRAEKELEEFKRRAEMRKNESEGKSFGRTVREWVDRVLNLLKR